MVNYCVCMRVSQWRTALNACDIQAGRRRLLHHQSLHEGPGPNQHISGQGISLQGGTISNNRSRAGCHVLLQPHQVVEGVADVLLEELLGWRLLTWRAFVMC